MMAQLLVDPFIQFLDSNGDPLSGGKVYSYEAGTSTPTDTYTDQGAGTPNANPVILDSAGRAQIWLDPAVSYKIALYDSDDVLIDTADNISYLPDGFITTAKLADSAVTSAKINDSAVTTAKINDLAVTSAKLANDAVSVSKLPDLNYGLSDTSGAFSDGTGTEVDVTNLSYEITTNGRPVLLFLQNYRATVTDDGYLGVSDTSSLSAGASIYLYRDSTEIAFMTTQISVGSSGSPNLKIPPGAVIFLDEPSAGTYTYKVAVKSNSGDLVTVRHCKLVAVEL